MASERGSVVLKRFRVQGIAMLSCSDGLHAAEK